MGTYRTVFCVALLCLVTSETDGYETQQPSTKWAFAQSYSWVVSNNGNPVAQQSQEQAARLQQQLLQQQIIQQAQCQQAMQQQASQLQARQNQIQAVQRQATQDALQKQAVQQNIRLQSQLRPGIQSIKDYTVPNDSNGQLINNFQIVSNLPTRTNEYTQEFIDEIVGKVIAEARGNFALPTTRDDIEKIVRKILLENSPNNISNVKKNNMNRYLDNGPVKSNNGNSQESYANNRLGPLETFYPQQNYPVTANDQFKFQAKCFFNCDRQPIAAAMANSIFSLNRSNNPRMVTNSFSYTSL